MKRYIKSAPTEIDVVVTVDHPLLTKEDFDKYVAAAYNPEDFDIPTGPVISRDRNKITQEMISDYECFVDDVESLCTDNYGLIMTYQNESDDLSHYYNYLATDKDGNVVAKLRFRLRVANHPARRSKQQKFNKNSELDSEEIKTLLTEKQLSTIRPYTKEVIVNNEIFSSYREAFDYVDRVVSRAVDVLTK